MEDRKVALPLMVRSSEDLQFVEEDYDTASDTEPSTTLMQGVDPVVASKRNTIPATDNVYSEISPRARRHNFLAIPKVPQSRSTSTESTEFVLPALLRSASVKKKSTGEYEILSLNSHPPKKISMERFTEGNFFRRRFDHMHDLKNKGDEEDFVLESLRLIVRKCSGADPIKRPSSADVLELLEFTDKS